MRVGFISQVLGMFRGGGETYFLNIAKALQQLDCQINYITTKPLFSDARYAVKQFDTDYVPSPYLRDLSQKMGYGNSLLSHIPLRTIGEFSQRVYKHVGWRIYNFDYSFSQKRIFKFLKSKEDHCDIFQVHSLPNLAARIVDELKKPVVIRFPGPPSLRYRNDIEKCTAVIASGHTVEVIRKLFRQDVHDIPPGIDHELFKPVKTDVREIYNIGDKPLMLFVGRFVPLKNIPFLIQTFREVLREYKNAVLMLVGEGPLEHTIKSLVSKHKIQNVVFVGRVSPEELPKYYSAADLFILTSSYESFSIATLEAMSCGLPVIATRVGYLPSLVANGKNGFLVDNGNNQHLRDAISTLLTNKDLCQKIGKRNREMVKEKYSWMESAKKLKRIYESLLFDV